MIARSREGERGSVLVEFALAGLVSLLIIFGIFDFGRALFTYDLVANAARLGTRYAIVRGSACTSIPDCPLTQAETLTYLQNISPGLDTSKLNATLNYTQTADCPSGTSNGPGCIVTVSVSYPFTFTVFPYLLSNLTIQAQSQMIISQ